MVAVPNTYARLSHAFSLRVGGRVIGAVHQVESSSGRTVDTEFEVGSHATGMPVDTVPQTVDRRDLRIARYDTYASIMEEVFGTSELFVLADQAHPFALREVWRGPAISPIGDAGTAFGGASALAGSLGLSGVQNAANRAAADFDNAVAAAASSRVGRAVSGALGFLVPQARIYEYVGCWFSDLGRRLDAKGDRTVSVDATIIWTGRRRVA